MPKPITSASASRQHPRGTVIAAKKKQRQQYGDRGSWLHFLTNSFHGVLGASSLMVTLAAWISNSLVLTLFSVITTTVLSIHSSWYMLEQSPHQSTILDWQLKLRSGSTKNKNDKNNSVRLRVVAPHRGAFHRTSIIMQYANTRILLLLQRKYWHDPSASTPSTSGVLLWGLATLMCLRMVLGEKFPFLGVFARFRGSSKRKTISSVAAAANANSNHKAETTLKPLPPFWRNGNTYCFVLPMILSVCADFTISAWCELCYISLRDEGSSLFDYFSLHWLSLWHLLFLQVVAHAIAFAFTLAFRIKHLKNKKDKETTGSSSSNPNSSLVRRFYNIRTLYWVCTIGVYALVVIGLIKMRTTLRVLK